LYDWYKHGRKFVQEVNIRFLEVLLLNIKLYLLS
jgi:hypothetical protein